MGRTDLCCVLGAADLQEPPQPSREKAPSLIQAAKCSEELHRKGISVLVLHKNIPKIPPCLLPGLWAVVTRGGVWDARQLWGLPSLGGGRITAQPRGDRVCQGGHSVSREGMWQEVTRAGMCHDVAESSSCPGAGLGWEREGAVIPEMFPGHLCQPQGAQSGHCPSLGAPRCCRHLCKVTSEQVVPALAAWRCHQVGSKKVVPGINMHK